MFDSYSEQQVFIMYGIVAYLTVFPVLLVAAAITGHLQRKAAERAATETPQQPVGLPTPNPQAEIRPAA